MIVHAAPWIASAGVAALRQGAALVRRWHGLATPASAQAELNAIGLQIADTDQAHPMTCNAQSFSCIKQCAACMVGTVRVLPSLGAFVPAL